MNANELADVIDKLADAAELQTSHSHAEWHRDIANFIRQQQAEIEALKKEAALQRLSDFTQEAESFDRTASHMADEYVSYNEPVAWIAYDEFGDFMLEATPEGDYPWQPLYTHPAKTLTDGEIMQVWWDANDITDDDTVIEFARAILRKAQEK